MNNAILAMLGVPEILVILLILVLMAGGAVSAVLLVVWLVRRGKAKTTAIPPVQSQPEPPKPTPSTCPRCSTPLPADSPQGLCPRCVMGVGLATQTEASGEYGPHGTKVTKPPLLSCEEVARRFPQLEILECLGRGGMGVVYKARQPKLNRLVALKILAPERGADPKFAERFLREAQALARLSHPNIVTVHDFGEADGMFFLLMEYVDGVTLRQWLREGRMKPEEALAIVPKICEALQFAHEQGVVHRDIKPENVLLDKQGRVKIADFGIAKIVGAEGSRPGLTEERAVLGTPHYMAPEQVEHPQTVDHRADIYSLGVVFYEMLTGELPLGKFQPPSKKVQVDVRLDEVVLHALEKEPERRYQRVSEVKTDVEKIASTAASQAASAETLAAVRRQQGLQAKSALFTFAAACFLVAAAVEMAAGYEIAAALSVVAVAGFGAAAYRHWRAAASCAGAPAGSPSVSQPAHVPASEVKPNRWEVRIIAAGLAVLVFLLLLVPTASPPFNDILATSCVIGLTICFLRLAGLWPFPSFLMLDSGFSGRNLHRAKGLNYVAFFCACLSGLIPTIFYWYARWLVPWLTPQGQQFMLWLTLIAALLAVALGFAARKSRLGTAAIVVGGISLSVWLLFFVAGLFASAPNAPQTTLGSLGQSEPVVALPAVSFGPVIERVLNDDGIKRDFFIDLDTGRLFSPPPGLSLADTNAFAAWLRDNGIDAMGKTSVSVRGLVGMEMIARPLDGAQWESLEAHDALANEVLKHGSPGAPVFLTAKGQLPETFLFKTREGGVGVLQITGFTDNPRGAKIRYKLVRRADANPTGALSSTSANTNAAAVRWVESNHTQGIYRWRIERLAPCRFVCFGPAKVAKACFRSWALPRSLAP